MRFLLFALALVALPTGTTSQPRCDMAAARPWIERWLGAWDLTAKEILHLPDAPSPNFIFFDSTCVYTTMGAPADGPKLRGSTLAWRAIAHDDSLTLPDGSRIPVALLSFANIDRKSGPYFVMAAPSYWHQMGVTAESDSGPIPVFLHEFAHTRQVMGMRSKIGPIDSTWKYPEELDDDAVQKHFGKDSVYVAAYLAERDLLYRAASASSVEETRRLGREALAMMQRRHARWFVGDKAEFAILDDTFLSLEGAAQWAAAAWLSHPQGAKMTREAAVSKMIGKRRFWAQDESLALFLVVDRLLPNWPQLVFADPSVGALTLLERAVD